MGHDRDHELRSAAKDVLIRYGGDAFPHLFRTAKGTVVTDDEGREILDFTSGQMCSTLGHNHPAITAAIRESCDTALHMFSGMIPEAVVKLGRLLSEWLPPPLKKSLFLNTGSGIQRGRIAPGQDYYGRLRGHCAWRLLARNDRRFGCGDICE